MQIIVICSISSITFDFLLNAASYYRILATFFATMISTFLFALPLAAFDQWWLKFLSEGTTRILLRVGDELQRGRHL